MFVIFSLNQYNKKIRIYEILIVYSEIKFYQWKIKYYNKNLQKLIT